MSRSRPNAAAELDRLREENRILEKKLADAMNERFSKPVRSVVRFSLLFWTLGMMYPAFYEMTKATQVGAMLFLSAAASNVNWALDTWICSKLWPDAKFEEDD